MVIALISATGLLLLIKSFGILPGNKFDPNFVSLICFILIFGIYNISLKFFKKKLSTVILILFSAGLGIVFSLILT